MSDWLRVRVRDEVAKKEGSLTPMLKRLLRMGDIRAKQRAKNIREGKPFIYLNGYGYENQRSWQAMAEHVAK